MVVVQSNAWLAHEQARPGQDEMISHIIQALKEGGHHLAAAPTGIGKTAASLAGALHHSLDVLPDAAPIMFLTGRQSQHRIVVETVRAINERIPAGKRRIGLVDLVGQKSMCIQSIASEHPALFSRMCAEMRSNRTCKPWIASAPSIAGEILSHPLHVEELVELANNHQENGRSCRICPWKAARDTAKMADIIVCDYNHIFNDGVRDASLAAMGLSLEDMIIVVDEAHNLPERIRRGLERRLTIEMVRNAQFEMEEYTGALLESGDDARADHLLWSIEVLKTLRNEMTPWFRNLHSRLDEGESEMRVECSELQEILGVAMGVGIQSRLGQPMQVAGEYGFTDLCGALISVSVDVDEEDGEKELACHRLLGLLEVLQRHGDSPALLLRFDEGGNTGFLTTHLLDSGVVSGPILKKVKGSVMMSGTLHPPRMFADLLSVPMESTTMHEYESPFLGEKRPVAIANDVSSAWKERSDENTSRIRLHIESLLANATGHVAVFAPSYAQLQQYVGDHRWRIARVIHEDSTWSKAKADRLLDDLEDERSRGRRVMLAGVYGGRLSEGIDYHNNLLSAVICIGIPMAPPSVVSDALRQYYSDRFGRDRAWRYATTQPAINAVMQAMGRPIRGMGDRAFVLLLDKRLLQWSYRNCLPANLSPHQCADAEMTGMLAARFFRRNP